MMYLFVNKKISMISLIEVGLQVAIPSGDPSLWCCTGLRTSRDLTQELTRQIKVKFMFKSNNNTSSSNSISLQKAPLVPSMHSSKTELNSWTIFIALSNNYPIILWPRSKWVVRALTLQIYDLLKPSLWIIATTSHLLNLLCRELQWLQCNNWLKTTIPALLHTYPWLLLKEWDTKNSSHQLISRLCSRKATHTYNLRSSNSSIIRNN